MIYEANVPSSACRLWQNHTVETSAPPTKTDKESIAAIPAGSSGVLAAWPGMFGTLAGSTGLVRLRSGPTITTLAVVAAHWAAKVTHRPIRIGESETGLS